MSVPRSLHNPTSQNKKQGSLHSNNNESPKQKNLNDLYLPKFADTCAAQSVHSSENNMFRSQSEATRTFNYLQGKTQMLEVCTFHDCRLQIMKGNLNLTSWKIMEF